MIKKLSLFLIFIFAITLTGCDNSRAKIDKIKIGALLDSASETGISAKNAAQMAVNEVNERGGVIFANRRVPVELVIEDYHVNPGRSIEIAKKLIKQDRVVAMVGPNTNAEVLAAAKIAQSTKTVLIAPWFTANIKTADVKIDPHTAYVFRASFSPIFAGRVLANFARYTKNYKTAAIIYDRDDATAIEQADFFKESFEALGGKIVVIETYKNSAEDFTRQLSVIAAARPELIFLPDSLENISRIVPQVKKLGIAAELLGSTHGSRTDLMSLTQDALEGVYFASQYFPDDRSHVTQEFVAQYQALYGKVPDEMAALTYDAYQILFDAITAIKVDQPLTGETIRNSLWELPVVEGVSGTIDFTQQSGGEAQKSAVILQVQEGELVWIGHANP